MEQSLLGACILDKTAYWRVADIVQEKHFARAEHSKIWRLVASKCRAGIDYDGLTLSQEYGSGYLVELASSTGSTSSVRAYANAMIDAWQIRQVQNIAFQAKALSGTGPEQVEQLQQLVNAIVHGESKTLTTKDVLRDIVTDMQNQCNGNQVICGLSTGFEGLDAKTSGLQDGDLIVIAGRPSMGKSLFAMQIGANVALAGKPVLIVSLEMSAVACGKRLLTYMSHIPLNRVMNASLLEDHEWPAITDATKTLQGTKLFFEDKTFKLEAICARIRQQAMTEGLRLVVIDYLGYIILPKAERQDLRIQEATRMLKALAKELQIPIILVCQINRGVEHRAERRPTLADLRDSGAIEQDADLIMFAYRDDYYDPDTHLKGFAEINIAKQRNGPTVVLPFRHRLELMRFDETEELPRATVEPIRAVKGFSKYSGYKAGGYAQAESSAHARGD